MADTVPDADAPEHDDVSAETVSAPDAGRHRSRRRRGPAVPAESTAESPPELPPESPSETPQELPPESPSETPQELPSEAPPESPPELPSETPQELPSEAPPEAPQELPPEAPPEAPPELPFFAIAEESPETPPEVLPEEPVGLRIAVIVCTHNRYDTLADTLRSLAAQSLPADQFEVLVIDNSTALPAQQKFWRLHKPPANGRVIIEATPGLSRARNIGLRATAAPLVVYIDDDAVASTDWLRILVDIFAQVPECGIAGGPVVPVWVYPGHEPAWLHRWQRGFLTIVDRGPGRRRLDDGEWLAGTNIAFRRDLLERLGGFNESLGRIGNALLSNEELEVSDKIAAAGFTTWYDNDAKVLHRIHANRVSQAWLRRRVGWQAISDQMSSAAKTDDEACWTRLHEYFRQVPVEMRGVRGLFLDVPDPDLYYAQCRAIEALVTLLIGSGRDPEGRG